MADTVDVWGVFDLEAPAEETADQQPAGEQEQEIAEPANEGEQDQELAEPEHDDEDDGGDDGQEPDKQPDKKPLTREERAANAARRRQKEVDDAVNAALEKERAANKARVEAFLAQAKIRNQHAGNAEIRTLEDAEAWAESDRLARLQRNLKQGSLTPEDLQTAVEQSPAFKALQEKQAAADQAAAQQTKAQFDRSVEMELAQIQKINPEIKSLADIIRMPTGGEFGRYVQQYGMSYLEAYKLANHDQLLEQARAVAATGAKVASAGKDHMTKTTMRGQTVIEVPQDVKANYKLLDPTWTDADIEKEYRKFMGKK